jgi:hypothetical protein
MGLVKRNRQNVVPLGPLSLHEVNHEPSCTFDRIVQPSIRDYSRAVATLVTNCMRRSAVDDTHDIAVGFVESVPLTFGFDFLCEVARVHIQVRRADDSKLAEVTRYIADVRAVAVAIVRRINRRSAGW